MNGLQFFDQLKKDALPSVLLMEGTEEYMKDSALAALRGKLLPQGLEALNESRLYDPEPDALIACMETLPFMADKRLVLVRESGWISQGKNKEPGAFLDYLKDPAPTAQLVLFARGAALKTKKLYTTLDKMGNVAHFDPLVGESLLKWVSQTFRKSGKPAPREVCERLVFISGSDLNRLNGEIQKLIAYAGGEDVQLADIDLVCSPTTEYKAFELADRLFSGDGAGAFARLSALRRDGEDDVGLLSMLEGACRRVLYARLLREKGNGESAIGQSLGVPSFAARRLIEQGGKRSTRELWALNRCLENSESDIKNGRVSAPAALERAMLRILAGEEWDK